MYPQIHFRLDEELKNGTLVSRVESPSRNSMEPAIYDVLGPEIARELIYFSSKIGIWDLEGYISTPMINRSDRSLQFINVNGRPIRHKVLQSTIEESYKSQLLRNTHPIIILKIKGPPSHVDFNIHPQKSEIRFRVADPLIEQIPELILRTLSSKSQLPEIQKQKLDRINKRNLKKSDLTSIDVTQSFDKPKITSKPHKKSLLSEERRSTTIQKSLFDETIIESNQNTISVLGHIMNKFGIVLHKNEIWLVDVHAADERVKFEMYGKSIARDVSTQILLMPMSVSLTSSEKQIILDYLIQFKKFGLKISDGGGNKILVHSVPVFYDQEITDKSIIELISDFTSYLSLEDSDYGSVETPLDRIEYGMISRLACHGSVRSGYPVSNLKIKEIVNQLLDCEYPWTCAHGRPTVLRLSKTELETMFKR
jgi:DNA mismatch repair protein MutL